MQLPERDRVRLEHMLSSARSAARLAAGRRRDDLDADEMLRLALIHTLAIIGEAASQVSPESRSKLRAVPWSQIVGMRHRLIHGYFDVDLDRVWDTVVHYVPSLIEELEAILP